MPDPCAECGQPITLPVTPGARRIYCSMVCGANAAARRQKAARTGSPDSRPVPTKLEVMSPKQVARVQAAYGVTCPYCEAKPGSACQSMNTTDDVFVKVPHSHRIYLAAQLAKVKAK